MDRVIEAASRIAAKYGAEDLDSLAERLGVAVYDLLETERLKELYFPNLKAIALRPGLPLHERRFLLAHGLGHHVLHRDGAELVTERLHRAKRHAAKTRTSLEHVWRKLRRAKLSMEETSASLDESLGLIEGHSNPCEPK